MFTYVQYYVIFSVLKIPGCVNFYLFDHRTRDQHSRHCYVKAACASSTCILPSALGRGSVVCTNCDLECSLETHRHPHRAYMYALCDITWTLTDPSHPGGCAHCNCDIRLPPNRISCTSMKGIKSRHWEPNIWKCNIYIHFVFLQCFLLFFCDNQNFVCQRYVRSTN